MLATLEYIQLGQTTRPGVSRVFLPVANDINSDPIPVHTGFAIGTQKATTAYVRLKIYLYTIIGEKLNFLILTNKGWWTFSYVSLVETLFTHVL